MLQPPSSLSQDRQAKSADGNRVLDPRPVFLGGFPRLAFAVTLKQDVSPNVSWIPPPGEAVIHVRVGEVDQDQITLRSSEALEDHPPVRVRQHFPQVPIRQTRMSRSQMRQTAHQIQHLALLVLSLS